MGLFIEKGISILEIFKSDGETSFRPPHFTSKKHQIGNFAY